MEGQGNKALPEERSPKKGMSSTIAIIVVAILIIAAIGGTALLMGGKTTNPSHVAPTITVAVSSTTIKAGDTVAFATGATADGKITHYNWQFGDGSAQNITSAAVTKTYNYPGKYIILVTVTDEFNLSATNWNNLVRLEVLNPDPPATPANNSKPQAIVAAADGYVVNGTTLAFNATQSIGYSVQNLSGVWTPKQGAEFVTNFTWNWADGSANKFGPVASHVFTGNGVMHASYVLITSNHSATQRYYNTVVVAVGGGSGGQVSTFVEETTGDPDTLDPAVDYETAGGEVLTNVYETLIWYDGASAVNLTPMLATNVPTAANGGISPDGLSYTFTIRDGVKFQDGNVMTAADVEYSLERVLSINNPNGPAWMMGQVMIPNYGAGIPNAADIANSVTTSGNTVTVHLIKPYPAFIYVMAFTVASVVEKSFVEAHGGVVPGQDNIYMTNHCMGTGPYKLDSWTPGAQVVLKKNSNYWRTPAQIDIVVIKQVGDFGARLTHLQGGAADSIYVPRKNINQLIGVQNVRIVKGNPTIAIDFIGMTEHINPVGGLDIGNIPMDFFSDINVRQAFVHAFNYSQNIASQYFGTAITPNSCIPQGIFGYNASVPSFDYNLSVAASYLKKAINPATGHSWADDGFTITVFYNTGNTVRQGACEILANGLQGLHPYGVNGTITVNVQSLTWSPTYLGDLYASKLSVFVLGWQVDYADADDFANPFLQENGTYAAVLGLNNHTLSLEVEKAAKELNPTVRAGMYFNISMEVYKNAYYLWSAQATNFHVERSWITGYYYNPMYPGLYFYSMGKNA